MRTIKTLVYIRGNMSILKLLTKDAVDIDPWWFTLTLYSLLALFFDLYLLVISDNKFLSVISIFCLFIGFMSFIKWADKMFKLFLLAYLIPAFLMALGAVPSGELIGINTGDFIMSAYATAGSTLIPPIATLITVPTVLTLGYISRLVVNKQ